MKTIIFASEHYFNQRHNAPDALWINMEHVCDSAENYQVWLDSNIPKFKDQGYEKFVGLTDLTALVASHCEYLLGIRTVDEFNAIVECLNKPMVRRKIGETAYNLSVKEFFPAFVKPIHSSLSQGSGLVRTYEEYMAHCDKHAENVYRTTQKYRSFGEVAGFECTKSFHSFYGEEIIPDGTQITVDVLSYEGEEIILSISESVFHPHIASFDKFDFPFTTSLDITGKIKEAAVDIVSKLSLHNLLFNIEFIVHESEVYLVEVNPRPATQFIPAIQAVNGFSAWEYLNTGVVHFEEPSVSRMAIKILRTLHDETVHYVPSIETIKELREKLGVTYNSFVEEGKTLSDYQQDGVSYRIGELYIPYGTERELEQIFQSALCILSSEGVLSSGDLF